MIARVLAIAGSDSGGGAGIQADIKTITMLGGHAMTAVTALTAQNTAGVDRIMPVPADMVLAQIDAVVRDIGVDAVKIGMISSPQVADAVAGWFFSTFDDHEIPPLVFDPVMVASSGAPLADRDTVAAFERLMGLAVMVTPNLPEMRALAGLQADAEDAAVIAAAVRIVHRTGAALLLKGGHGTGGIVTDRLIGTNGVAVEWSDERIDTIHDHGTGCTLSSAIAVGLAGGMALADAIGRARAYVRATLLAAPGLGRGHGPMGHGLGRKHFIP